jgi:hypothetical protein
MWFGIKVFTVPSVVSDHRNTFLTIPHLLSSNANRVSQLEVQTASDGGEEARQFKHYLDEKKVMDSLSRIIVSLYEKPEKPPDPLTYIRDFFAPDTGGIDIISVRAENVTLMRKLVELQTKVAELRKQLQQKSAQPSARDDTE